MAKLQGDTVSSLFLLCITLTRNFVSKASASAYHARFATGAATLDKLCFTNGKYYTQVIDPAHNVDIMGDGTTFIRQ